MSSAIREGEVRSLTRREFEQFRRLAYEEFGLDLHDGKEQLVSARLGKKIRELRFQSYQEYYRHVLEDQTGEALAALIDALTTNHTSFFRESAHFDYLRQTILPGLRDRSQITIWSAACSSGEEPYTIAFSAIEELGEAAFDRVRILATDISNKVLANAHRGVYPAARFEPMPAAQLRRYLLRGQKQWKDWYQVKPEVRRMVEFRRLNLMEDFAHLGPFPVIFCRNVMIYFDKPTQQELVRRLAARLEPGGYLLIGHAESLNAIEHPLRYLKPAVYGKAEAGAAGPPPRRGRP
jgi:chemotaxis protein methyltransferase CheR